MKHKKKKIALIILLGTVISTAVTYAIAPMVIQTVLFPAIGQNTAVACDTDGTSISYTYGATKNGAIKVTAATITGINVACKTATVIFVTGESSSASYTGTNTTGSVTIPTDVWTNDFTDVRVVLIP